MNRTSTDEGVEGAFQRKFGTHAVSSTVSSILVKVAGLILVKILTNTLPRDEFGSYSLWISFAFLTATFSTNAFSASLWRFMPRRRQASDDSASRLVGASFLGSSVFLLGVYAIAFLLFHFTGIMIYSDPQYIVTLFFVALLSVCYIGIELVLVISGSEQNSREILLFNIFYFTLSTVAAIVSAIMIRDFRSVIFWLSIGYIVPLVITIIIKFKKYGIRIPLRDDIKEVFKFGGPSVIVGSVVTFQPFLAAYFVGMYLGTPEIGSLSIALSLSTLFAFIISPPLIAYKSYMVNSYETGTIAKTHEVTSITIKLFLSFAILIGWLSILYSTDLILLFSTNQYLSGVLVVPFAVAASIMMSFSIFAKVRIDLAERTHLTGSSYLISAVVLLTICVLLVPPLGFYGIGIAILAQAIIIMVLLYYFGNKFVPIKIEPSFVLKWSVSIIALISSFSIMHFFNVPDMLVNVGSSFFYCSILFLSGAIDIESLRKLKWMVLG